MKTNMTCNPSQKKTLSWLYFFARDKLWMHVNTAASRSLWKCFLGGVFKCFLEAPETSLAWLSATKQKCFNTKINGLPFQNTLWLIVCDSWKQYCSTNVQVLYVGASLNTPTRKIFKHSQITVATCSLWWSRFVFIYINQWLQV